MINYAHKILNSKGETTIVAVKGRFSTFKDACYYNTLEALTLLEKYDEKFKRFIESSKGKTALIKPNSAFPPAKDDKRLEGCQYLGPHNYDTTDPDAIRAVVDYLLDKKIGKVLIAESVFWKGGTLAAFQLCGYYDVISESEKVKFIELTTRTAEGEKRIRLNVPDIQKAPNEKYREIEVNKILTTVDFIVNMPKLKTHVSSALTGAIKNYFGFLNPRVRFRAHEGVDPAGKDYPRKIYAYHYKVVSEAVAQTHAAITFSLNLPEIDVVDGVICCEGDGPHWKPGSPREDWIIFASFNEPVAMDKVLLEYTGVNRQRIVDLSRNFLERIGLPKEEIEKILPIYDNEVYHVKLAETLGLGSTNTNKVKLILATKDTEPPSDIYGMREKPFKAPKFISEGACTIEWEKVPKPDELIVIEPKLVVPQLVSSEDK